MITQMKIIEEHLNKARHYKDLFEIISTSDVTKDRYLDWEATLLFYAALHYIDAWLVHFDVIPEWHSDRQHAIGSHKFFHRKHYRRLEDKSRDARYKFCSFLPNDIQELSGCLSFIQQEVEDFLKANKRT